MAAYDWFAGLATIGGFLYFLAGFACAYLIELVAAKVRRRKLAIPWETGGIAIGVAAIVIVTLQTQIAYTTAKNTAVEVQRCQVEFNEALRARAKITTENDEASQDQRRIIFDWIHDLIFPPEPFSTMDTNDRRRQEYGITRTIQTEQAFQKSLAKQDVLQRQRDEHPYPDPTCGR
jgi:hypothetical protein